MRERIIAEIRRLAGEIGRPPGSHLFEVETGLRVHRWRGLYWARWSDALREAGLEPNRKLEKADPDVMLEQLAIATRWFGHFPVAPELDVYRRTRPVAGQSTLREHFGGRAGVIARLRAWTASRPDYADVAALLPPAAAADADSKPVQGASAHAEGFLRLFRCRTSYRFGRSTEADGRVMSPPIALPKSSVEEHAIRTDDPAGVEAYWRRRFAYRRIDPEWFALTPEDVAAFRRWKQI